MQEAAVQCFREQPKEFFADVTFQILNKWDFYLNVCGNFS
jgi:hypothetical protein